MKFDFTRRRRIRLGEGGMEAAKEIETPSRSQKKFCFEKV